MQKMYRPGYFGRRRDEKIQQLNALYGDGKWELRWVSSEFPDGFLFKTACIMFYEHSYMEWFNLFPEELDFITTNYGECIDNAISNIQSGCDYARQEAFSTHIQDIALRNVIADSEMEFKGPKNKILVIRSSDSNGHKYGPGNIPFYDSTLIETPSIRPRWANAGSVEDFWQSNKYIFADK